METNEDPCCIRCRYCAISGQSGTGSNIRFQARCRRYAPNPEFAHIVLNGWCGEFHKVGIDEVLKNAEYGDLESLQRVYDSGGVD